MVFVENYFALTKQKWCHVNGTAKSRSKCPTKEPCTCISDKQFDTNGIVFLGLNAPTLVVIMPRILALGFSV